MDLSKRSELPDAIAEDDNADWFVLRPEKAQAFGRPVNNGFLVQQGSTAMRNGSPRVKRDRKARDSLIRQGVLVNDIDPELYRFSRDHVFRRSSPAGGIVKDGNCSGPQSWLHLSSGKTLKDVLG